MQLYVQLFGGFALRPLDKKIPPRAQRLLACLCLSDAWDEPITLATLFKCAGLVGESKATKAKRVGLVEESKATRAGLVEESKAANALHMLTRVEQPLKGSLFHKPGRNRIELTAALESDYRVVQQAIRPYVDGRFPRRTPVEQFASLVQATLLMREPLLRRSPDIQKLRFVRKVSTKMDRDLRDAWDQTSIEDYAAHPNLVEVLTAFAIVAKRTANGEFLKRHLQKARDFVRFSFARNGNTSTWAAVRAFSTEVSSEKRLRKELSSDDRRFTSQLPMTEETALPDMNLAGIVGRTAEVEDICTKLIVEKRSFVSIVGEAGIGKTTLAVLIGRRTEPSFAPGGVSFVKLSPLDDPERISRYVCSVIGLDVPSNPPDRENVDDVSPSDEDRARAKLVDHFKAMRRLLILDNCEHLGQAPETLIKLLLKECRESIQILVTSRRAMSAEDLEGVDFDQLEARRLTQDETIALFIKLAGLKDKSVNANKLARLARRLHGTPFNIELAARRYRTFRDIDRSLRDANTLSPEIEVSLEKSYKVLRQPAAQFLFQRLWAFYGGWDDRAMSEVCFGKQLSQAAIKAQRELESLFLISVDGDRHRINPSARQFARALLQDDREVERITRAHAEYYTKLAWSLRSRVTGRDEIGVLALLARDQENFKRALMWCRDNDSARGLRLATGLWRYWVVRGSFSFGRETLSEFLAVNAKEESLTMTEALAGQTALAYFQSDYLTALATYRRAAKMASDLGDLWSEVVALVVAAVARFHRPRPGQDLRKERKIALWDVKRSVELADKSGSPWLRALAHSNRAFLLAHSFNRGFKWKELEAEAADATSAARAAGNEFMINIAIVNQGAMTWASNPKPNQSYVEGLFKEALQSRFEMGDRYGVLQMFGLLAGVICSAHASTTDDYMRAAILLAAQDAMQDQREMPIPALNTQFVSQSKQVLEVKLGSDIVGKIWAYAKKELTQVNAVRYALGEIQLNWDEILR